MRSPFRRFPTYLRCALAAAVALSVSACEFPPDTHLEAVLERGELRVLTRYSATTYYQGPFGPTGLEYDLAAGFAEYLGVDLDIEVPDNLKLMLRAVRAGDADLAAAGLSVTEKRLRKLNFGPVYQRITPQLVYRVGTRAPRNLNSLSGSLEVVAGSSHAERLRALRDEYPDLSFTENAGIESEQLLNLVWEEVIDFTVADSNEVAITRRFYPELRVAFDISTADSLAWAFPPGDDRSLLNKAEAYFDELKSSGRLDQLLEHYYGYVTDFDYVGTRRYMKHIEQRLPLYRKWFREAARATGEDWRLLAAMGYQESHWDPEAVSPTGVRGIMMLTRDTMRHLGLETSRHDAQSSITGGARYFASIKKRLPKTIRQPDRSWMALAAYNVGYGHLSDARQLAREAGADPDNWAEVKRFLPLLTQKKWYKKTRYGYARGHEPVRYVENIRSYYDILVWQSEREHKPQPPSPGLTIQSPAL